MTSGLAKGRNASRQSSSATARASFSVTIPSFKEGIRCLFFLSFDTFHVKSEFLKPNLQKKRGPQLLRFLLRRGKRAFPYVKKRWIKGLVSLPCRRGWAFKRTSCYVKKDWIKLFRCSRTELALLFDEESRVLQVRRLLPPLP